jgi:hypothetical protein
MKITRNHLLGGTYLALAAGLMLGGMWFMRHDDRLAAAHQEAAAERVSWLKDLAAAVSKDAPVENGPGVIISAHYDKQGDAFTFNMRANPTVLPNAPDEAFFFLASEAFSCRYQTEALIELNREVTVKYQLFSSDGIAAEDVVLDQGSCTDIPWGASNPKDPWPGFPQTG